MPYIRKEMRETFDYHIESLVDLVANEEDDRTPRSGIFNYIISALLWRYLRQEGMSYNRLNSLIGVLECAKMELYRRMAVPYEDEAIKRNGDI